jgi:hypothetical protein
MTDKPGNTDPLFNVPPLPVGAWLDPALPASVRAGAVSDALFTPARRAGIAMFVLAGLMLLMAIILFAVGYSLPHLLADPNATEIARQWREIQQKTNIGPQQVMVFSFVVAGIAAAFLVLAPMVLRGARLAIILATILTVALSLYMVFSLIVSLADGQTNGVVLAAIVAAALCVLSMWLWAALGAATTLRKTWADSLRRRWAALDQQQPEPPGFMAYHAVPRRAPPPSRQE